ncbi:unnamed protein product [Cylindrotheca closterium]|uniref:L domain-like protein n=1 Tax=Cylindrotheca closterium TaxID=2856 RepID=A0AAD2PXD2_9STRA|nr:unnamed protein product [Cylindrotheca closterium]
MARRQRPVTEADQENPGLQRPSSAASEEQDEEPHRYLCLVMSFPAVILLGVAAGLTIYLISLKSNNDSSKALVTSAPSSPEDWFDFTENLGGNNNDDLALSFPTQKPTQNPTRITSNLFYDDDDNFQSRPPTVPLPQANPPSLSTMLPTIEPFFIEDARNRFQQILVSRSTSGFTVTRDGDGGTPQAKALNWLIRDPRFYSYTDDRLLQRWVLATFAFGMVSSEKSGGGGNSIFSQQQQQQEDEQQLSIPQAMQNWVRYTDECTRWFYTLGDDNGKTVCDSDGLYVRLDLRLQHLVGTLPSEIALLSNHLRYIHLFDNRIQGTLPTEFGLLTKLERLELTKNDLVGPLPSELGNLDTLRFLGIGQNSFEGPLPTSLGKLSRLNTIGLEWNQFTEIPSELGNMVETRILNMDHNAFATGGVPTTLGQLSNLKQLNLIFNSGLVGTMPVEVCNLKMDVLQADCDKLDCDCCTFCNYYNSTR